MAYTYSHLYSLKTTGLGFTVYGYGAGLIWLSIFSKTYQMANRLMFIIMKMKRDFTYVSDIINGSLSAIKKIIVRGIQLRY